MRSVPAGLLKVTKVRENGDVFLFNILVPGEMFPHASLITPGPIWGHWSP
jgi:CRP/FNR family cyclic AMP-dependent transcriptional regulator